MDQFWIGAGAIAGLSLIGVVVWTVLRIRRLENLTWKALETIKDDQIKTNVHALSDAELDALVGNSLGAKSGNPKA